MRQGVTFGGHHAIGYAMQASSVPRTQSPLAGMGNRSRATACASLSIFFAELHTSIITTSRAISREGRGRYARTTPLTYTH